MAFYDGVRFQGASYFLAGGQSVELSESWWNRRISSLRGVGEGTVVTLFEDVDRSGSSLTLTSDLGWPDLEALGWSNRAVMLIVWPKALTAKPTRLP